MPARAGYPTFVLADPLYAFIHRTETAKSLARIIAPGAQIFGGGTGIELQFFEEVDRAVDLSVPGAEELASMVLSGGALCILCSYFLDPESHFTGDQRLPHSVEDERRRLLWHERVWQSLDLLPKPQWLEVVDRLHVADTEDLRVLRRASKKTHPATRAADMLAKAFVEMSGTIDGERLIRQVFPAHLQTGLVQVREGSRPTRAQIDEVVSTASQLGPWPEGLDLGAVAVTSERVEDVERAIGAEG
ncbi:MAG: hypothetical protein MI919_14115 [Holophagales bacterium]|nr:hypothetical protein [Holophagales bacterium]